ncbi:TPA: hypothetical protein ACRMSW_006170, partial [Pseudomonas aeruginosa]
LAGIGTFGTNWVAPSRAGGTVYTNDTSNNLAVSITYRSTKTAYSAYVDGKLIGTVDFEPSITNGLSATAPIIFIVPPGSSYEASAGFTRWTELR